MLLGLVLLRISHICCDGERYWWVFLLGRRVGRGVREWVCVSGVSESGVWESVHECVSLGGVRVSVCVSTCVCSHRYTLVETYLLLCAEVGGQPWVSTLKSHPVYFLNTVHTLATKGWQLEFFTAHIKTHAVAIYLNLSSAAKMRDRGQRLHGHSWLACAVVRRLCQGHITELGFDTVTGPRNLAQLVPWWKHHLGHSIW